MSDEQSVEFVKVTQVRSGAGRLRNQRETLLGLGLKKINQSKILANTPETRGMIACVQHLVTVEPVSGEPQSGQ